MIGQSDEGETEIIGQDAVVVLVMTVGDSADIRTRRLPKVSPKGHRLSQVIRS